MYKTIKCLIVDDEPVAREILENHLAKIEGIEVVAGCKNAIEAFNKINSENIDLIFLDINMPEISGLSFARSINRKIKMFKMLRVKFLTLSTFIAVRYRRGHTKTPSWGL